MHAPISTGTLGHLSQPANGMGAAARGLGMTESQCRIGLDPGCDPNASWTDLIFGNSAHGYYSTFCRNQRDVLEGCIKGEYPGIPTAPPAAGPALIPKPGGSATDYEQQSAATQAERDAQALRDWNEFVRGYQPDPPKDESSIPWLWIAAGAAAIILVKRV